jgi:hypothetical protein
LLHPLSVHCCIHCMSTMCSLLHLSYIIVIPIVHPLLHPLCIHHASVIVLVVAPVVTSIVRPSSYLLSHPLSATSEMGAWAYSSHLSRVKICCYCWCASAKQWQIEKWWNYLSYV